MFEFYERVSGARMHAAYIRPGGVHQVSPPVPTGCPRIPPVGDDPAKGVPGVTLTVPPCRTCPWG